MTWNTIKLGDACTVIAGGTPKRSVPTYWDGIIPWVKISDMLQGRITRTDETISQAGLDNSAAKLLPSGTLLISIFATIGRTAVLGCEAATNQAIVGVIPNDEKQFDLSFLEYSLKHKVIDLKRQARGVAQTNINGSILKATTIPLPPLAEQKRIAGILDAADALRKRRREALAQLDTLLQSTFLDMFGDPVTNPMGWEVCHASELAERITVGIVVKPASHYVDHGVPALRSLNVRPNRIELEKLVFFSHRDNETTLAKTRVWKNDILLVRSRQPGTAAIVPEELNGVNAIDLLILTPREDVVHTGYLCHYFNSAGGRKIVLGGQRGQIQKHLNVGVLKTSQIPLPPLDLQQRFAAIVESVEQQKARMRTHLEELDTLFASLQSRAFNGEL